MSKKKDEAEKTKIKKSSELDNMVLDGLVIPQTFGMRYDNTQPEPVELKVEFDFDSVILGRLLREAAMKQLIVTFRSRERTKFSTMEDFLERHKAEQTKSVADLLSPMARKKLTPLEQGEKAVADMDDAELSEFMAKIEAERKRREA